jgi:hypothetical protein
MSGQTVRDLLDVPSEAPMFRRQDVDGDRAAATMLTADGVAGR